MATMTIRRIAETWGLLVDYRVVADGKIIGKIGYDEEKSFELHEGQHELWAKVNYYRSNKVTFSVREADDVCFECGSVAYREGWFRAVLYSILRPHKLYWVKQVSCR